MFGTRLWGVKADLWCLAKGISSGYVPLGATAISAKVAEVFDADTSGAGQISHGYTYSAHPVAAAAALATLKILVERWTSRATWRAWRRPSSSGCAAGAARARFVGDVRGHGPDAGHRDGGRQGHPHAAARSSDIPARVARAAYRRGLMVRISGPNLILSPPLVITRGRARLPVRHAGGGVRRGGGQSRDARRPRRSSCWSAPPTPRATRSPSCASACRPGRRTRW
jgi:putrescine---pyruvate transaminase